MLRLIALIHIYFLQYQRLVKGGKKKSANTIWFIVIVLFVLDKLGAYIYSTLPFITKLFPFSLLYKDKLFHHQFRHLRQIVFVIESAMAKIKRPILILSNSWDKYFLTLEGNMLTKKDVSNEKIKDLVCKTLKLDQTEVFVRTEPNGSKNILLSREGVKEVLYS